MSCREQKISDYNIDAGGSVLVAVRRSGSAAFRHTSSWRNGARDHSARSAGPGAATHAHRARPWCGSGSSVERAMALDHDDTSLDMEIRDIDPSRYHPPDFRGVVELIYEEIGRAHV